MATEGLLRISCPLGEYWRALGESETVIVAETVTEAEARLARQYYMAGFRAGTATATAAAAATAITETAAAAAAATTITATAAAAAAAATETATAAAAATVPAKPPFAVTDYRNTITESAMVPYTKPLLRVSPKSSRPDRMISHPGLIAVRNGVLRFADLTLLPADTTLLMRTGRLGHHDPIPYDPTAKSDELMEFLNRLFPDPDVLDYVLCAVASSIDGIRRTPNLFLCHGTGSNGKSAFQSLVEMTLGDYATTLQAEILCRKSQLESIKRQVAGKRWIGVGEPVPGASLHVGTLTNLLESNVAHAFLFTCELPSLKAEEAFWAKVRVLPFLTTFGTGQVAPDLHLQQKLPTWRTAFLSLLIGRMAAATAYPRVEPERVTQATLQYRRANDPFLQFVSEYLIPTDDPTLILTPPELRSLWREFRKANALGPPGRAQPGGPPGLSGGDLKESDVLERLRGVAYGSLIRTAE